MSSWSRALDELVRERGAALFGYAYVLTGNAADAEDLVQSALVRTFRTGRATRGIDSTHAYVKRAIASTFVDGDRRAKARPQRRHGEAGDLPAAELVAPAADPSESVAASLDLPPGAADAAPTRTRLRRAALSGGPPHCRRGRRTGASHRHRQALSVRCDRQVAGRAGRHGVRVRTRPSRLLPTPIQEAHDEQRT